MRRQLLCCGLLMVLGAAGGTHGAADARATDVLSAAQTAIGADRLRALKSLSVEAALQRNVSDMQLTSDVEILLDLPDRYLRSDTSNGPMSMTMATGFNAEKPIRPANAVSMPGGGMMIRLGGPGGPAPAAERLSPEELERADKQLLRAARADISRLMLGWFALAHPTLAVEYTYAGEAESPDGKADVIDVKESDGFSARLFVDQQTRLPLMVTYRGPLPRVITQRTPQRPAEAAPRGAQTVRTEIGAADRTDLHQQAEQRLKEMQSQPAPMADFTLYFEEWRVVDGVKFPHKIRRATGGSTTEEWTITRVRLNPKIDPKKFDG